VITGALASPRGARKIAGVRGTLEPTYSVLMARPFFRALARCPRCPPELVAGSESAPDDLRLPVAGSQEFLQYASELVGEENLGLLAALETGVGTFEVLEFVVFSAPTWRSALETAFRYVHLLNEAACFRVEVVGDKAHLVLASSVPLSRPGIDFQNATMHLTTARWLGRTTPELEVWFSYPEPRDLRAHHAAFGSAKLCFGMPWNGFVHDAALLDDSIPGADPKVHALLRQHADSLLAELAPGEGLVERLRAHLMSSLKSGPPSAAAVAAGIGLTRRTLTRRLAEHGTSFSDLLDDVRRQAATHYVTASDHSLIDIAFLVGFSESSAFVRAFKRWHGVAPMVYRRAQRERSGDAGRTLGTRRA
jgi:AraC-like DNA-binding protein